MTAASGGLPARPGVKERRPLSETEIVAAALRLTRRVGVAGLSMRALADELAVTTMAAYYHVPNKAALLELVANSVLDGVQLPPDGDWPERLAELQRRLRLALLEYPGMSTYLQERPLTNAGARMAVATLAMLEEAGFSSHEAKLASATVQAFLLGRLSMEEATGPEARARPRLNARQRRENEVFEYGMAAIIAGLRTSIQGD